MIIIPIWRKADEQAGVLNAVSSVTEVLKSASIKVKVDNSDQRTPGWKFNFWEMKVCIHSSINPCITLTQQNLKITTQQPYFVLGRWFWPSKLFLDILCFMEQIQHL